MGYLMTYEVKDEPLIISDRANRTHTVRTRKIRSGSANSGSVRFAQYVLHRFQRLAPLESKQHVFERSGPIFLPILTAVPSTSNNLLLDTTCGV
ncbi:unnamed protein product [Cylicocyclus nassatus]|uniref:Uncharacterized protein n=1 Tax=Cylicocyclus nassatus TaxID=53992 RepID=A0AA36M1K7_CYLNA|nr:unnamed protein product [Cylicocyclus nassatus]